MFCKSGKNISTIFNQSSQNIFQVLKFNTTLFSYIGPNLVFPKVCITCADMNRNYTYVYEGTCLNVYDVKFKSTELLQYSSKNARTPDYSLEELYNEFQVRL